MRTTIIFLSCLLSYCSFGQINIGMNEMVTFKTTEFKEEELKSLKSTKTIFVYREEDKKNLETLKTALTDSWRYTPLEFMSYKEYSSKTFDDNYSFFTIGGIHKIKGNSETTYIYLLLWMNKGKKKIYYSRIELFPSFDAYRKATQYVLKDVNLMMNYLYEEATLYNWYPGYLKNALQLVGNNLEKAQVRWLFQSEKKPAATQLRTKTLYIPDYTLIELKALSGDESERHDVKELLKKYPYPYKVVTTAELSEMILDPDQTIYYLSYIKSCTDKFVSVINSKTGEIIYSEYSAMSYNIKDKDFEKLAGLKK